jgi:hypothetical protein
MSASLPPWHFAKISLHFPKMQGETGSFADTARLIYLGNQRVANPNDGMLRRIDVEADDIARLN